MQRPCRFSHSAPIPEVRLRSLSLSAFIEPLAPSLNSRGPSVPPRSRNGRSSTGFFFVATRERARTRIVERDHRCTGPASETHERMHVCVRVCILGERPVAASRTSARISSGTVSPTFVFSVFLLEILFHRSSAAFLCCRTRHSLRHFRRRLISFPPPRYFSLVPTSTLGFFVPPLSVANVRSKKFRMEFRNGRPSKSDTVDSCSRIRYHRPVVEPVRQRRNSVYTERSSLKALRSTRVGLCECASPICVTFVIVRDIGARGASRMQMHLG